MRATFIGGNLFRTFTSSHPAMRRSWLFSLFLIPAVASSQTTVYSNNFESGAAGASFSGAGTVQTSGGLSAFGFGELHLKNDGQSPTILSLSGIAAHSSMTLKFSLGMWDSIDWGGDLFVVKADGVDLFNGFFGNYGTPSGQCEGPGTQLTPAFIDFFNPNYGYGGNHDCARAVSFTFAHSASTVAFAWSYPNSQNAPDESFGIDNVLVQIPSVTTPPPITGVPEPSTYAMMGAGLVALFLVRRKQRA